MNRILFYLLFLGIAGMNLYAVSEDSRNVSRSGKFDNELVNSYYYVKNLLFAKDMISKEYFLISLLNSIESELIERKKLNQKLDFPSEDELKKINKDLSSIRYNIDDYTLDNVVGKLQKDALEEHNLTLLRARLLKSVLIESATSDEKIRMFNGDLKNGLRAYAGGDFEYTNFLLNEIISSYNYKNMDDVLFYKGESLVQMNSYTEAARTFQRIVEEYPESAYFKTSLDKLISLYYLKGEYDKIVSIQKVASKTFAVDSILSGDLIFLIGLSYYKTMQYGQAESFLKNVKETDQSYNQALYLRANSLTLLQKHNEAKELYLKVKSANIIAKKDDINNVIYEGSQLKLGYLSFNVAEIHKKIKSENSDKSETDLIFTKSINEAMDYFSRINEDSRYYQDALMGKAWVEHNLGDYNKSNGFLDELIIKYPNTDFVYEAKTLQGFNKEMLGLSGEKNSDYEFVLNAHVELTNNELFVSERLLIASLVTKLSSTKRFLLEQNAPMSKFYQYQDSRDSLMLLLKKTNMYMQNLAEDNQKIAEMSENSYRKKLLTAIINSTKKEINRLNDLSVGLFEIQEKLTSKSNYKELVHLVIEKNNVQNLLQQADAVKIFSDKKIGDLKNREVDIQRWSDLSFLKYVLSNLGIEELDKIERDLNQINLQINKIDNDLNTLPK